MLVERERRALFFIYMDFEASSSCEATCEHHFSEHGSELIDRSELHTDMMSETYRVGLCSLGAASLVYLVMPGLLRIERRTC